MQGAEGTHGHGAALSRGLDDLSVPGPSFKGTDARADWHYLNWVDRYDTLGFGKDVQVVLGTGSDSLLIFKPETKQWLTVRVPYPMGFYTRDIDGRIDDPNTGWKGRGSGRPPRHA